LSAIAPTAAISSTAAKMTTSGDIFRVGGAQKNKAPPDTRMVVPTTATPALCGVGTLCDERAFGIATA
jgi:hypothetical protein